MIEGLHFDIPYVDLHTHLKEKARFHAERANWYQQRIEGLQESGIEEDMKEYSGGSPLQNMENKHQEHYQRFEYFNLLADYLIENEMYRLSKGDLIEVELIKRYY